MYKTLSIDKYIKNDKASRSQRVCSTMEPHEETVLSATTIRGLEMTELSAGHLCALHQSDEQGFAVLRAFLEEGLERGEKVIYIADQHTTKPVIAQLERNGICLQPYLTTGQMDVFTVFQSFLRKDVFEPARMASWLDREAQRARAEGYHSTRIAAEMTWVLRGAAGSERLIDYEAELNELVHSGVCSILCLYDTRRFSPAVLQYVFTSHPAVVLGTAVHRNSYYCVSPGSFGGHPASTTLNAWMAELGGGQQAKFF